MEFYDCRLGILKIGGYFSILRDDQVHKDRLDIRPGAGSPYYDESYPGSDSTVFLDLPGAQDPYTRTNHYFYAETYLVNEVPGGTVDPVTGIVKNRVEIYSGVRWGWENEFTIPVDLALVFDTSGSMWGAIVPVTNFAYELVYNTFAQFPDTKVAITNYRDFPSFTFKDCLVGDTFYTICTPQGSSFSDRPYQAILPFSDIRPSIYGILDNSFYTSGGGDLPETAYSGLINTLQAKDLRGWREDAKKVIIHFTDAVPHDPEPNTGYTAQSVIDAALNPVTIQQPLFNHPQAVATSTSPVSPVSIYNVYLWGNSAATNPLPYISQQTGGRFYNLNNVGDLFDDLLEDLSKFDSDPDPDPDPQPVPEPTTILGLLMLSVGGIFQRLKRRF